MSGVTAIDIITSVSSVIAAGGIVFAAWNVHLTKRQSEVAVKSLSDEHEWRRRHYTSELLINWNLTARVHLAYLNDLYPGFQTVPDFIEKEDVKDQWRISEKEAQEIFDGESEKHKNTRDHLVALFNYLEGIAVAWEKSVVDQELIRDSCAVVIIDTFTYFEPFVLYMTSKCRREPWPPLNRVIDYWAAEEIRELADEKSKDIARKSKIAKDRLDERPPTGMM